MQLTPELRRALKAAYSADFGRDLGDHDVIALGTALLEALGPLFVTPRDVHRSLPATVDEPENKREPEESDSSSV